ncbi:VRR-NUC domain-containing protein [Burkholderia cepacia]|uniref:VRR-NUC domain-containing protein n=1 Tax=Burkholderia cepacia TaxID=292 RepID=UPI001C88F2CA|nr:VRR-NUC domain-containing protein [Burkholderia cepacia]
MLEKTVETYLVDHVRAAGGDAYKFSSPARVSVPDRIVIFPPARIYFVELKRPGGVVTKGQLREHERLRALGCDVRVIDSREAVDAFVREVGARRADALTDEQVREAIATAIEENGTAELMFTLARVVERMLRPVEQHEAAPMCELPMMRKAFRVTEVSGDPDPAKQSFAMRFSFPSIDALHSADDEWNKFIAATQPEPPAADERAASFERFIPIHELWADAAALSHRVQQGSLSPDDLAAHIRKKIDAALANASAPRTEVAGGHCERAGGCVCGGDLPRVREGCSEWVKPEAVPAQQPEPLVLTGAEFSTDAVREAVEQGLWAADMRLTDDAWRNIEALLIEQARVDALRAFRARGAV